MKEIRKDIVESNWEECLFYKSSYPVTPDKGRAHFLILTSQGRINLHKKLVVDETSANFIFEAYYTSIVELLQAITISQGYRIINHICLGYYLRDIMKRENLFKLFDSCRFKRNSLVYYGKLMEFEMAKFSIEQAKKLVEELNKLLENIK